MYIYIYICIDICIYTFITISDIRCSVCNTAYLYISGILWPMGYGASISVCIGMQSKDTKTYAEEIESHVCDRQSKIKMVDTISIPTTRWEYVLVNRKWNSNISAYIFMLYDECGIEKLARYFCFRLSKLLYNWGPFHWHRLTSYLEIIDAIHIRRGVYQLCAGDCDESLATVIKQNINIFHYYHYVFSNCNFQSSNLIFFSHKSTLCPTINFSNKRVFVVHEDIFCSKSIGRHDGEYLKQNHTTISYDAIFPVQPFIQNIGWGKAFRLMVPSRYLSQY